MADDLGPNGDRYNAQRESLERRLARIEERLGDVEKWQARVGVEVAALTANFREHISTTAQDARETLNAVNAMKGDISQMQAQRGMVPVSTIFLIIGALASLVAITGFVMKVSA